MGVSRYNWKLGEELIKQGKSDKEVARVLGCKTHTVVTHRMGKMGIKRRLRRHRPEDHEDLLQSGLNCNQIAKIIGCAPSIVYGWKSAARRKSSGHEAPREKATKAGVLFRIYKYVREEFESEKDFVAFVQSSLGRRTLGNILIQYNRLEAQEVRGSYDGEEGNDDDSWEG